MDAPTTEGLGQELDEISLRILQRRNLYKKLNLEEYQALKIKEREISKSAQIKPISLEEVFADFERNGSQDTQVMPKTFCSYTLEDSRKAYTFGHQGLAVYFATGTCTAKPTMELGLISAHVPGGSGGGGWGLNGTRKLQVAPKPFSQKFNPNRWIENSTAWVCESYGGKLHYDSKEREEKRASFFRDIYTVMGLSTRNV